MEFNTLNPHGNLTQTTTLGPTVNTPSNPLSSLLDMTSSARSLLYTSDNIIFFYYVSKKDGYE